MLSNNTFLETRIQRLLDCLIFVEKGLVGKPGLGGRFGGMVKRYIRVGYNLDIM